MVGASHTAYSIGEGFQSQRLFCPAQKKKASEEEVQRREEVSLSDRDSYHSDRWAGILQHDRSKTRSRRGIGNQGPGLCFRVGGRRRTGPRFGVSTLGNSARRYLRSPKKRRERRYAMRREAPARGGSYIRGSSKAANNCPVMGTPRSSLGD